LSYFRKSSSNGSGLICGRAKERATILRRLVRDGEDHLYAHDTKREHAPSLYDIRTM